MIKAFIALALGSAVVLPSYAAGGACNDYIGKIIQPTSIDAAILQLSKVPNIKGEFETQAHFEERQKQALANIPAELVIAKQLDLKQISYDADAGEFRVSRYAFDNLNTEYDEVFGYGTPFDGKVKYDFHNVDVVISQREGPVGGYVGANAMGGRARVTRVSRVIKVVFEGAGDENVFPSVGPDYIIGNVAMPPSEAQKVKPTLSGAIIIRPKWPFVAQGTHHWAATVDMPEDTYQRTVALVADISCGLMLDSGKKVLAAFSPSKRD